MIRQLYKSALSVLFKRFFRLIGIRLLTAVCTATALTLFGGLLIPGIAMLITCLIGAGTNMVFLYCYRRCKVQPYHIFEAFRDGETAGRVIKGELYKKLLLFLWLLIPFVGIIFFIVKSYRYALTPYILFEEDDVDPFRAYQTSKKRTKGFCAKMFWADVLPRLFIFLLFILFLVLDWLIFLPGDIGEIMALGWLSTGFIVTAAIEVFIIIVLRIMLPLFLGLVRAAFYEQLTGLHKTPLLGNDEKTFIGPAPYIMPMSDKKQPYPSHIDEPDAEEADPYAGGADQVAISR